MSQSVLIIEDEKEIADTLLYALTSAGIAAVWEPSGSGALQRLQETVYDLCIVDVGLPDYHGFELLKELRGGDSLNQQVPVMFLTARSEEIDRIIGLEIGADDYVCKPFSPREVVARAKVIMKRVANPSVSVSATVDAGSSTQSGVDEQTTSDAKPNPFSLNTHNFTIDYQQKTLPLTRAEYQLLSTLLSQPGRVFTRRQLIENIWSSNHPSDDRAIDTHIKTLRAKLKTSNPHQDFIITHRGFGYSLEY